MAIVDFQDTLKEGDLQLTSSQVNRAYNLLKYKFPSIPAIGLDIESMILQGLTINQIEQILLEYYTDFSVSYNTVKSEKNERLGKITFNFGFKEEITIGI